MITLTFASWNCLERHKSLGDNKHYIKLLLVNEFLCFQEQRVALISLNFWKKFAMCAEASQMVVHM